MTDKERILTYIISRCASIMTFGGSLSDKPLRFEHINQDCSNLKIGDVVLSPSFVTNPYNIGFVHEVKSHNFLVIREIGTNNLCNYSNQLFQIIKNIPKDILYEGKYFNFYRKCQKSFRKGNLYWYAFVDFEIKEDEIIIEFRESSKPDMKYYKMSIPKQNINRISQKYIYKKALDYVKQYCA